MSFFFSEREQQLTSTARVFLNFPVVYTNWNQTLVKFIVVATHPRLVWLYVKTIPTNEYIVPLFWKNIVPKRGKRSFGQLIFDSNAPIFEVISITRLIISQTTSVIAYLVISY